MKHKAYIQLLGLCATTLFLGGCGYNTFGTQNTTPDTSLTIQDLVDEDENTDTKKNDLQAFLGDGLTTDTSLSDIDLAEVLDGGPGKDGIPALTDPNFLDIASTDFLKPTDEGTVFVDGENAKFYPNRILNRHEIINDTVGDTDIVVTFCPLCGTSLVFDPYIEGEKLEFGVSGKIRQSNLLMYDTKTESLRSQAFTKAKVGKYTGTKLKILSFDVMTREQYRKNHPTGLVLDQDTGHQRNYHGTAYDGYTDSENLYFPVDNNTDTRIHPKTMMIVVDTEEGQAGLVKSAIKGLTEATDITLGKTNITVTYDNGNINITDKKTSKLIHFEEMRFSYINRNVGSELVRGITE